MNKLRREALDKITVTLDDAKNDIEMLRDEEQEYMDNIPESLQSSEKYETAQQAICLDEAISNLEDAINNIQESES